MTSFAPHPLTPAPPGLHETRGHRTRLCLPPVAIMMNCTRTLTHCSKRLAGGTPLREHGKSTENNGNNISCSSNNGVGCALREKTQAAKQCIIEAQRAMSTEVHPSHALKGGAKSGRTVISIPKIPSPAPNHRKNLILNLINQKREPPNSEVPKVADTTPCVVLTRAMSSQRERGGGRGSQRRKAPGTVPGTRSVWLTRIPRNFTWGVRAAAQGSPTDECCWIWRKGGGGATACTQQWTLLGPLAILKYNSKSGHRTPCGKALHTYK